MVDQEVSQADLFNQLEKSDVKVDKNAAAKMKESILNDKGSANYLGLGVHEVFIQSVELAQAKTGTLGIKFVVENEEGKSDVTMWLSEAALPYTIENISRILVHNAEEDKKEAARKHMAGVVSAKEVFEIAKEKMIQYVCYLSIREDRNGRTYTDKNGETKPSLERSLLSYKPNKVTDAQSVAQATGGTLTAEDGTELPF